MLKVFSTMEGLEIVGQLESESPQGFEIKKAIGLVPHVDEKGNVQGVRQVPVALFADGEGADIWLNRSLVKIMCDAPDTLEKEYIKTTSGIELASKMPS
jgi:hypothetical protein